MSLFRYIVLVCAMSFVATAFGQLPDKMPQISPAAMQAAMQLMSGPPPLVYLISQKPVQEELKLDKAQKQKLLASEKKFSGIGMKLLQAKSADEVTKQVETFDKEVVGSLNEDQVARLKEISLRVQGPPGLLSTEVSKKLELTAEQTGKIKALSRTDGKKVTKILTEDQLDKLRGMLGKSFRAKIDWPPSNMPGMPGM